MSTDPHRPRHQVPLIIAGAGILVWCFASGLSAALRGRNADFNCFYDAARGVLGGTDIYTAGTGGYIYPPMLAAIMAPLGLLSLRGAAVVWTVLMAALLPAVGYLAAGNASERFASRPGRMGLWSIAALAAMVVGPELAQEFKDGNCNLLILLALVLSQRWLGKRPALCGLALGFAINIKYLPIVFIPYLIARGRWRELAWTCASVGFFAMASAVVFGWERNLGYLRSAYGGLLQMASGPGAGSGANIHPLAWRNSISLPSALARLAEGAGLHHVAVAAGVVLLAGVVLGVCWWMYWRARVPLIVGRSGAVDDADPVLRAMVGLEWPALFAGALIFSPQTVPRHVNMALPFVAAAAWMILYGRVSKKPLLMGVLALLFVGSFFRLWLDRPDGPPEPWRTIGGLSWCLLVTVLCVLWQGLQEARLAGLRPGGK